MCTLSWLLNKDGYSLIFNRDELNNRQRALPPIHKRSDSGTHFLSPTDTDAGGSWLIINEYGLTACLLNFYAADKAPSNDVHSRGEIVLKFTDCRSVREAENIVQEMDSSHYRGFDLVLFDSQQKPVQYCWDARTLVRHLPIIPLTSSSYRTDEICEYRRELFRELFFHDAPQNLQQLLEFHNCHSAPQIPAPTSAHAPCMHRQEAKTVSQCVVEVTEEQVSMRYADGSPCSSELSPPLRLERTQERQVGTAQSNRQTAQKNHYSTPGMPPLEQTEKALSAFEFWPIWLVYLPVIFQWLALAIRYRSLSLPLIANPEIPLSGMVGFSKSDVLAAAAPKSQATILPFITHRVSGDQNAQLANIHQQLQRHQLILPLVGKPDIGCRGAGVCLLENEQKLAKYLQSYPEGSTFMLQKLANWEPEAGVFYVRQPGANNGKIISLALKYSPYLVGDGTSTLSELLADDERAGQLQSLYKDRHKAIWNKVIPNGKPYKLVFSASHCRGAIFRDGGQYISEALTKQLDKILSGLPEFHYGRLDIKFRDTDSLMRGEHLEIVEINGASSEALHIWDSRAKLREAWRVLLDQYNTLFHIGHQNRCRGYHTPGITVLWRAWRYERKLAKHYPQTD